MLFESKHFTRGSLKLRDQIVFVICTIAIVLALNYNVQLGVVLTRTIFSRHVVNVDICGSI